MPQQLKEPEFHQGYLTTPPKSQLWRDLLLGDFSPSHRAIVVPTLNKPGHQDWTFEIMPLKRIRTPSNWIKLIHITSATSLPFVAFPLFLLWTKGLRDLINLDPLLSSLAICGSTFLYLFFNLRSDILDYFSGASRFQPAGVNRALIEGWTTASRMKKWSQLFLFLAICSGTPVILARPSWALWMTLACAAFTLAWTQWDPYLKNRLRAEVVVFLMFGPLLAIGFQSAIGGRIDTELLAIGTLTGFLALFVHNLKNFGQIMIHGQLGHSDSISRIGFEKSKNLLTASILIVLAISASYFAIYISLFWAVILLTALTPGVVFFLRVLHSLQSPLSSRIQVTVSWGRYFALALVLVHVIEGLSDLIWSHN